MTVVLQTGEAVRVALPFAPAGPLPKLALDALRSVLPAGLFHSLSVKHLLLPGELFFTPQALQLKPAAMM